MYRILVRKQELLSFTILVNREVTEEMSNVTKEQEHITLEDLTREIQSTDEEIFSSISFMEVDVDE